MIDFQTFLTIIGMAGVTALARVFGYWSMGKVQIRGRLASALEAVPGAILASIVAPAAFLAGPAEFMAALVTILLAWRLPMLVAVIGGVTSVVILRHLFG